MYQRNITQQSVPYLCFKKQGSGIDLFVHSSGSSSHQAVESTCTAVIVNYALISIRHGIRNNYANVESAQESLYCRAKHYTPKTFV